jgi:thioesterase domain-containing protein
MQCARLSAALHGERDVWVLPNPGFAPDEPLPADLEGLLATQCEAVRIAAGGEPFALLGVSSGGWVAHAVAERLERDGARPAAVVLLDTYLPTTLPSRLLDAFKRAWIDRYPAIPRLDEELTAMAFYPRLFPSFAPAPLFAPTLFVRCTELMPESDGHDYDWRATWPLPHDDVVVPGDHMTMLDAHADTTARAIDEWLITK